MRIHARSRVALATTVAACLLIADRVAAQAPPNPPGAARPGLPGAPPPGTGAPGQPPRDPAKPAEGTGTVKGRVVAADTGQPLRRARVTLMSIRKPEPRMTLTNADGVFSFDALPADRYQLMAYKPRYVEGTLGARKPGTAGRPFELADGQKIDNITVALATAGIITGRVLDDIGEVVPGARVSAMRYRYFDGRRQLMQMGRGATADDTGTYRMFGLAPGQYYVTAQGEDMMSFGGMAISPEVTTFAPTFYPSTVSGSEAQPVEVVAGAEVAADITLIAARTAKVRGTLVDGRGRRVVGGFVMVMAAFGRPGMGIGGGNSIKPDGTFELSGLTPGEYTLQAHATYENETEGLNMRGFGTSMPLTVGGSDILDLRVVIPVPVKIAGRIVYEGGTPTADERGSISASVSGSPMDQAAAQFGLDGHFTLEVAPGTRRVNAWISRNWSIKRIAYRGRDYEPGDEIDLTDEPGGRIDIVATNRIASLTGTVADGSGKTVSDYNVLIMPEETARAGPEHVRLERPDQQGRFRAENIRPGSYLAVAVREIEQDDVMDPEALAPFRRIATPVKVREGQTETLTLTLAALP
jgi:hypothetical protein